MVHSKIRFHLLQDGSIYLQSYSCMYPSRPPKSCGTGPGLGQQQQQPETEALQQLKRPPVSEWKTRPSAPRVSTQSQKYDS